jgi:hypothetical protein
MRFSLLQCEERGVEGEGMADLRQVSLRPIHSTLCLFHTVSALQQLLASHQRPLAVQTQRLTIADHAATPRINHIAHQFLRLPFAAFANFVDNFSAPHFSVA